jgi:oligoendopeptidase F
MFNTLPSTTQEFAGWTWEQIQPYFHDLESRELNAQTVHQWLTDWTLLIQLVGETVNRMNIATTLDTTDQEALTRFQNYLVNVIEPAQPADQRLKEKLLASGLQVEGMEIPLRNLRAEAELFREANIPLFTQEQKLVNEYNQIIGAQTVQWEGEERTLVQMKTVLENPDRSLREKAWRLISERRLADRDKLNELWTRFLRLRQEMATNAGYDSFRDYRWKQFRRFEYTPEDCETFHAAIEAVIVPLATRLYDKQRRKIGADTLRPWDLERDDVYPPARPQLHPFQTIDELESKVENIFYRVDDQLGGYFSLMRREGLLDLDNRKGKAPGGYQSSLILAKRPFIFMNAVGIHDDVQTLLHEGGHAFHWLEASKLPYAPQWEYTSEIAEVASMSMELLGGPYLSAAEGGFYTEAEAAHARIHHLEHLIFFWPFMAVVDAFQHWVYTHPNDALDPANCDAKWDELWTRFLPGVDWSGLDDARMTGWHRKPHIFQVPFYYVDYGLAQVGACLVWRNSLDDPKEAVRRYKYMLGLGGTRPLPALFEAAGAKLAFDAATLRDIADLIEGTIDDLEKVHNQ